MRTQIIQAQNKIVLICIVHDKENKNVQLVNVSEIACDSFKVSEH